MQFERSWEKSESEKKRWASKSYIFLANREAGGEPARSFAMVFSSLKRMDFSLPFRFENISSHFCDDHN